jgi:dienelactone hydrolase
MKRNLLITVASVAAAAGAMVALPSGSGAQAPPMGGGYTNVIPIPVNDPSVKAIAGALFKPEGAGPFPAVVYMSGCAGLNDPAEVEQERVVVDGRLAEGIATLIVDHFTPRGEMGGICAKLDSNTFVQYSTRGGDDAVAALKVVKAMPDIDPNRVFLQGFSCGAISSLFATDTKTPGAHDTKIAGLIAYYPYCYDNVDPAVPTLVLIGEKDDWTPAAACQALKDKPNVEVVVYAGATHGFTTPIDKPVTYLGYHIVHDEEATEDAQDRADAFIAAHMK